MFVLKKASTLKKDELPRVIHPRMAGHYYSRGSVRSIGRDMAVTPDEIKEALRRGEMVLLSPARYGKTPHGIMSRGGSLKSGLPPALNRHSKFAGENYPVFTKAEVAQILRDEEGNERAIEEENKCVFEKFIIASKGRNFKMVVDEFIPSDYYVGGGRILQVISPNDVKGSSKKKLSVKYESRCCKDNGNCSTIYVDSRTRGISPEGLDSYNAPFKFLMPKFGDQVSVFSARRRHNNDILDFLTRRMRPKLDDFNIIKYNFSNKKCCESTRRFAPTVEFFPQYGWEGNLAMDAKIVMDPDPKKPPVDWDWKVTSEIKINSKGAQTTLKADLLSFDELLPGWTSKVLKFGKKMEKYKNATYNGIKNARLKNIFSSPNVGEPKVTISSGLKVGGEVKLEELKDSPLVGLNENIKIEASPILQLEIEVDVLPLIINGLSGWGLVSFLTKHLKELSEKVSDVSKGHVEAGLAAVLKITGEIKGGVEWKSVTAESRMIGDGTSINNRMLNEEKTTEGKIEGFIKAEFEGKAFCNIDAFEIKVELEASFKVVGVKGGGGAGFGCQLVASRTDQDDPAFGGSFYFTGMKIVYCALIKVGGKKDESNTANSGRSGGFARARKVVEKIEFKREKKGDIRVLKPFEWEPKRRSRGELLV